MSLLQFEEWPKIPRYRGELVVTEKIDGTNAQVAIDSLHTEEQLFAARKALGLPGGPVEIITGDFDGESARAIYAGSRSRWLQPEGIVKGGDNFGFARFVYDHAGELAKLGRGRHYGEWWGHGIQRGYGLPAGERRFSLFNVARHADSLPSCCHLVPVLARGEAVDVDEVMRELKLNGSRAAPFLDPEGVIIFHTPSRQLYKRTFEHDAGKWRAVA